METDSISKLKEKIKGEGDLREELAESVILFSAIDDFIFGGIVFRLLHDDDEESFFKEIFGLVVFERGAEAVAKICRSNRRWRRRKGAEAVEKRGITWMVGFGKSQKNESRERAVSPSCRSLISTVPLF